MPTPQTHELQLDGLIGFSHFFGGLAVGNMASQKHAGLVSHPRAAALQGLLKMKTVMDAGMVQLVMPPHPRPALDFLATHGFHGSAAQVITDVVARDAAALLPTAYSASAMWAANAATVCASADAADGRVHITPANLISHTHRALETPFTTALLKRIFPGAQFVHHAPLASVPEMADEGAANHMRLTPKGGGAAVHVFVHGASKADARPRKYRARQSEQTSRAVAHAHQLADAQCIFVAQNPDAVDAGAFHNDVVATSNDHLLLYHEQAFADDAALLQPLKNHGDFDIIRVSNQQLPLAEAIACYLFNSQILTLADGSMLLLAPVECRQSAYARALIESMVRDAANPIANVQYIDVTQSMDNGGGPACLRLRLWLNERELKAVPAGVQLSDALYEKLGSWVSSHYPEQLTLEDLKNPELPKDIQQAYAELDTILWV